MRKALIALLIVVGLISCENQKSFKINVNFNNSTGKTVYLQRYDKQEINTIDSVLVENNKAVFELQKSDNTDAFQIMMNGWRRPLVFFADNKNVTIKGDYQNYNGIKVEASESQKKLNRLMEDVNKMENDDEIYKYVKCFVEENIDNPIGVYALYRYKWAFQFDDIYKFYISFPKDMQSGYKYEIGQYAKGLERTSVGQPFLNFKQSDINGDTFYFNDVVGKSKIVILDFWASWCPDCRKANPELVALYKEFKDKGLDIVSVSLDTDSEAWKNAIEKDSLMWNNHVSDLKGWNNEVAQIYTIAYIPQTFVIDENGMILEKNVPFDKLQYIISDNLK